MPSFEKPPIMKSSKDIYDCNKYWSRLITYMRSFKGRSMKKQDAEILKETISIPIAEEISET